MGLDQYLTKRTYVQRWDHIKPEEQYVVTVQRGGQEVSHIRAERVSYVVEQIGYWRKANQIHAWFVENCQGGKDECQEVEVSKEQLQALLDLCRRVREHPEDGPELLPTRGGFFFGDTDYGQYYHEDIAATIPLLEAAIVDAGDADIYYQSSW